MARHLCQKVNHYQNPIFFIFLLYPLYNRAINIGLFKQGGKGVRS